jgi:hypothetical protein
MELRIGDWAMVNWIGTPPRIGLKHGCNSLRKLINEDQIVAQRGKPSLPKLKFMEGLGPEDPKWEPQKCMSQ